MNQRNYNPRCPAVKRILREIKELEQPTYDYFARPLEDNIFEWHFTVRGAADSDFSQGLYHGRIILPNEYPMKPPSIILLTPNGRFQVNKKICLSISGYHPETWVPCWSIRTVLLALIFFMPTKADGAIGSIEYSSEERRKLAKQSLLWTCPHCGQIMTHLKSNPALNSQSQAEANADLENFMKNVSFRSESKEQRDKSHANESQQKSNELINTTDQPIATTTQESQNQLSSSSEAHSDNDVDSSDLQTVDAPAPGNFLDGPIINFFFYAIIALIVALIMRRFSGFF